MAFVRRRRSRREKKTSTVTEFKWVNTDSLPAETDKGVGVVVGVEVEEGGRGRVEGEGAFQVLLEGSMNMSVRVEGEEKSATMARSLRSLKSTGSFNKVRKERGKEEWRERERVRDGWMEGGKEERGRSRGSKAREGRREGGTEGGEMEPETESL